MTLISQRSRAATPASTFHSEMGAGIVLVSSAKLDGKARERLAKLVGMLAASSEGEVLNAARAITSTLKAAGADINDLAAIVKGDAPKAKVEIGTYSKKDVYLRMVDLCMNRYQDDKTIQFLRHMRTLLQNGRLPSDAQAKWLVDIYARGT
jgi:hypothetical protein